MKPQNEPSYGLTLSLNALGMDATTLPGKLDGYFLGSQPANTYGPWASEYGDPYMGGLGYIHIWFGAFPTHYGQGNNQTARYVSDLYFNGPPAYTPLPPGLPVDWADHAVNSYFPTFQTQLFEIYHPSYGVNIPSTVGLVDAEALWEAYSIQAFHSYYTDQQNHLVQISIQYGDALTLLQTTGPILDWH